MSCLCKHDKNLLHWVGDGGSVECECGQRWRSYRDYVADTQPRSGGSSKALAQHWGILYP